VCARKETRDDGGKRARRLVVVTGLAMETDTGHNGRERRGGQPSLSPARAAPRGEQPAEHVVDLRSRRAQQPHAPNIIASVPDRDDSERSRVLAEAGQLVEALEKQGRRGGAPGLEGGARGGASREHKRGQPAFKLRCPVQRDAPAPARAARPLGFGGAGAPGGARDGVKHTREQN